MSNACACQSNPCNCQSGPDPMCPPAPVSKCDLYRPGMKNVWVDRGCNPGDENAPGICLLDTMSEEQVIYSIERDEKARADLLTVTSDPKLRQLATTIPALPVVEEADAEQAMLNRSTEPASLPFYQIFRGQPPFAQ
jgi:hypothetical protein